ncbi:MAG: hypothetical protein JNN00_13975 [Chitinophagaceae bacterium]|nr:hypothetical protein [Chitinophagaceae bacterium]
MDYEIILYPEHEGRIGDTRIADEEMAKIILFLRFKTKSGKTIKGESSTPVKEPVSVGL